MAFIDVIKEKARKDLKTIVLPEGMDRRTWEAAAEAVKQGLAKVIVLASPEEQAAAAEGICLDGITVIDPKTSEKAKDYISKGMSTNDAAKTAAHDTGLKKSDIYKALQ